MKSLHSNGSVVALRSIDSKLNGLCSTPSYDPKDHLTSPSFSSLATRWYQNQYVERPQTVAGTVGCVNYFFLLLIQICQCSSEESNGKGPDSLLVLTEVSFESSGCLAVLKDCRGRKWSSSQSGCLFLTEKAYGKVGGSQGVR